MRFATFFFAFYSLRADEVTMKNGDRLSGSILKFDGKAIQLKSDYAGTLTITWEAVAGITSSQPLNLGLQGGQVVVGTVTTSDDKLTVQTTSAGAVVTPRAAVQYIRNKDEEAVYQTAQERLRNPRLVDLWTGNVALGYAKTQGNSKTTNLNVTANAVRATARDKTSIYFTSLFSSDGTSGRRVTTANAQRGGFQYNLNLTPKLYLWGGSDFESDQFQLLDLRFVPGGGAGWHAIKSERTVFDLFAGGSLDREYYSNNLTRSFGEAQFGDEFLFKFSKVTSLHQKDTFFLNISNSGEYRNNLDISADTKLRKWLAWQVAVSDRYISNPLPGRQKNDLIITTGVNLLLAK